MPQKHDNYTRKVLYGIGHGGGKSDYKDCFRSQKHILLQIKMKISLIRPGQVWLGYYFRLRYVWIL